MKLSFTKMQGCANDYIYLDCRESGVPENIVPLARDLSRRHFSVGADGIICICAPVTPGADGRMRIFNADGSEAHSPANALELERVRTRAACYASRPLAPLKSLQTLRRGYWKLN